MAFARGPQAQNEPQRTRGQVRLVRVRHDRGIEQRRGFERILVTEIRAEQQLPFLGRFCVGSQTRADLLEPPHQELADLRVAVPKLGSHLLPERVDFGFREAP